MNDQKAISIRSYMRSDDVMDRFAEAIGDRQASAFVSSVLLAVANNDKLAECEHKSIAISAMRAATLRLSCDPSTGQAHLVPFKGKATLIVGYKGLVQMALRTGKYRYLNIYPVREGQIVEEDWKTGHHSLSGQKKRENPIIGHLLSFALITGFEKTVYMTVEEIHDHAKRYSKSYGYKTSPWKTNTFEMEQKTVMRLGLGKWGYFDPHDIMAMSTSDDVDDMPELTQDNGDKPDRSAAEIIGDLGYDVDEETGEVVDGEVTEEPKPVNVSRELAAALAVFVYDRTLAEHGVDELTEIIENKDLANEIRGAAVTVKESKLPKQKTLV